MLKRAWIFLYDEPSRTRDENLRKLEDTLIFKGPLEKIVTSKDNPVPALGRLHGQLRTLKEQGNIAESTINLDVSTFTKRHLLLLLKSLDDLKLWDNLRIFYTEPQKYVTDLYLPMSIGIQTIAPVNGFISKSSPSLPSLLIIFLGYEGDRARTIYENLDPENTILIVPRPAYHKEWEKKTERMNRSLIRMVGEERIQYTHSIDPFDVAVHLQEIADKYDPSKWRWIIVPLGTKPQAIGIYFFWRSNPNTFSIVYGHPFKHNERFFSTGIGRTWLLKDAKK
jgi:hypothetical protein